MTERRTRLTLVHNPRAGEGGATRDDLVRPLRAAGWEVRYADAKREDPARLLADPGALVVVAGGDGTVASVAREMAGCGAPLAILPTGGANNVARSLGVQGAVPALLEWLRPERLPEMRRRPWNVGVARAPWGERRFVEGVGIGLLGLLLRDAGEEGAGQAAAAARGGKVAHGRRRLRALLDHAPAHPTRLEADGEALSGEYLLAAVLDVRIVGPRLTLAPGAGRGDDHLALVTARAGDRAALRGWLAALGDGGDDADEDADGPAAPVTVRRARRVRLSWTPASGHLDDEPWPDDAGDVGAGAMVEASVLPGRVELLLPG